MYHDDVEYEAASHKVGECPARDPDCNGIPVFGANPFALEIFGDDTPEWACEGVRYESVMNI